LSASGIVVPDWSAPPRVRALSTTRRGGVSSGPYESFNLGTHCGDDIACVTENRERLKARYEVPSTVCWLNQVHGCDVVDAGSTHPTPPAADAAFSLEPRRACAILTADCIPVLICDRAGTMVAAAHCGWRGLAQGVLGALLKGLPTDAANLMAWMGPGIGRENYEVGADVRDALLQTMSQSIVERALRPSRSGKWLADLYELTRSQLNARGVSAVSGGDFCTYRETRFYSYRRDGVTGRIATLIWLEDQ
jgi:polyphenol oxidase